MNRMKSTLSRRQTLQIMAVGLSGPAATELLAKERGKISPEMLETATALVDRDFSDERLDVVAPALERNLQQFAIVRELEIDDLIEPVPVFFAGWR